MRSRYAALAATLATLVLTGAAHAGKPHDRTGFFIGFGFGGGSASWDWKDPDWGSPDEWSGIGNFRIGGAVKPNLVLHLESSAWVKQWDVVDGSSGGKIGEADLTLSAVTFAATFFPGNMGFYLRGGLGFATANATFSLGSAGGLSVKAESTDTGLGLVAATGYEWRLTDKFAMGPQVELVFLGIDGDLIDNALFVDGSLQFNWYW
ncbi:MAG: autotransporter outer membrane beta-barrel domain-containing protein [Candidatus Krumholzibacteria bacterium]|nr:autotransporter outer membrane beta-barrel domain-containing protein [Candidatus Krumholzibacteria bacterium]